MLVSLVRKDPKETFGVSFIGKKRSKGERYGGK